MNKDYTKKFPSFCNDTTEQYILILTDDLDSLFSCIILNLIKGYRINNFYTFEAMYQMKELDNERIGVDLDLVKGLCWANHVTMITPDDETANLNCANLNVIEKISRSNYFEKYAGNTVLQILSYYKYDISNFSEEAKMILLCIDSHYLGFYSRHENDRKAIKKYLCNVLKYQELYDLLVRHKKSDFEFLQKKYNLKSKIIISSNGRLETKIDLNSLSRIFNLPFSLPQDSFTTAQNYKPYLTEKSLAVDWKKRGIDKIYSWVISGHRKIKFSYEI